jgi:hypothetical protein
MRYLHPVQMHEKFVASGTYRTLPGGEPSGSIEQWSIHEQPGGTRLVRIDDDTPAALFLIEAWVNLTESGRVIDRIDVYGRSKAASASNAVQTVRATYTYFDDHIQIGRTLNDAEREHFEHPIDTVYVGMFPGSRLLLGYAVARAAQIGTPTLVAAPNLDIQDTQRFLLPHDLPHITATLMDETPAAVQIGAKTVQACRFEVTLDGETFGQVMLDANDVLLKTEPLQSRLMGQLHGQFELVDYARRPL